MRPSPTSNRNATPATPALTHETAFWVADLPLVAGVDEVGRGALAGPLVAAAVVLPAAIGPAQASMLAVLAEVRDSKVLRPERRAALVAPVTALAVAVGIGAVAPAELDSVGLAAANRLAMERAVFGLGLTPDALLLDACVLDLSLPQVGLIDGDARCLSIAAASIIAKVHRDELMIALDAEDDRYSFARHKGYGSALHIGRLRAHGPGPHHRRCFAPVAACAAGWAATASPAPDDQSLAKALATTDHGRDVAAIDGAGTVGVSGRPDPMTGAPRRRGRPPRRASLAVAEGSGAVAGTMPPGRSAPAVPANGD